MVFQAASLFPMSIFENIAYGVRLEHGLSRDDVAQRVESALTRADLWQETCRDRID
jgi:phosphate transport system ATP-binding protein